MYYILYRQRYIIQTEAPRTAFDREYRDFIFGLVNYSSRIIYISIRLINFPIAARAIDRYYWKLYTKVYKPNSRLETSTLPLPI